MVKIMKLLLSGWSTYIIRDRCYDEKPTNFASHLVIIMILLPEET